MIHLLRVVSNLFAQLAADYSGKLSISSSNTWSCVCVRGEFLASEVWGGSLGLSGLAFEDFVGLLQTRVEEGPVLEDVLHLGNRQINQHTSDLGGLLRSNKLSNKLVQDGSDLFAVVGILVDNSGQDLVASDEILLINGHLLLGLSLSLLLSKGLSLHLLRLHLLHLLELGCGNLPLNGSHVAHGHSLRTLVAHHAVLAVVGSVLARSTMLALVATLAVVVAAVLRVAAHVRGLAAEHEGHLLQDHLEVELEFLLLVKVGPLAGGGVLSAEGLEILLVLVLLVLNLAHFLDLVVVNN